jgi:hypothetical protein
LGKRIEHQMLTTSNIDSSRGAGKILTNSTGAELTRSVDVGAGGLQNLLIRMVLMFIQPPLMET